MDEGSKMNYKDTLNLPKTNFSMKANLPQREPDILKKWDEAHIYRRITESRKNAGRKFVLHDGPPYANGHIHMGHVLNKILKDICVKYYSMKGYLSPFVPGWDCHGLPVEHQLFKELGLSKHEIDKVEFRKKAYNYAMKFVKIQAGEFKRLGVFGDWEDPYLTLTREYESDILESLADLYAKGYVYKDLKPVNWCSTCETALAEAEVEYEDKTSPSIYVKFDTGLKVGGKPAYLVIWTTTPWTLLANVAVALHPEFMYSFVSSGDEVWIVASDLEAEIMKKAGITEYGTVEKKTGRQLADSIKSCRHPFIDRASAVVLAEYVTKEEGTGCVHTAPGHGQDDYFTGKKYGLPMIMPVDEKGRFTADAGEFAGTEVYKANSAIIEKMRRDGMLIKAENITHSYPHCWRCKAPIIFRATKQWFLGVDHLMLREKLEDIIRNKVKWVPPAGMDRIGSMVKGRPDWCLSRQRYWGVPIPAFKCPKCLESFTDENIIRKVSELTRKEGSNVWFEKPAKTFLPEGEKCPKCGNPDLEKEDDILDVWFDSGVSHKAVLGSREELAFPADLYLEGSDQHRGWFQSALITSVAMTGKAPYKEVLTHGFVVDGEGKKMSKSIGNVISPQDIMKKYGADILRLWVASSDYEADIKLSPEILERLADGYRKIRNTFRFLLSNLYDFDPSKDQVPLEDLPEIDRWMLSKLSGIVEAATGHYEAWEFHKVYRKVYDLCVYEVSAVYLDILKDSLYILAPDSLERRAHQTVIFKALTVIARVMAPIICFTAEEVWGHLAFPEKRESIHTEYWPTETDGISEWRDEELDGKWDKLLSLRDAVMKSLEVERASGIIGSSLEAAVFLGSEDEDMVSLISDNLTKLPVLLKVSSVDVSSGLSAMQPAEELSVSIRIEKAKGAKCPRCWNYGDTAVPGGEHPELCRRCREVVSGKEK
jgi:isoleucyl-tRNA synthetase